MIPYPLDASLTNKPTIVQTPQARANWTTKAARILSQLRTDPQKPEKWRLRCTSFYKSEARFDEHESRCWISLSPIIL